MRIVDNYGYSDVIQICYINYTQSVAVCEDNW